MKFHHSILSLLFLLAASRLQSQIIPAPDKTFAGKGFAVVPFGVSGFATGWQTVLKPNGGYYTVGSAGNFSSMHMAVVSFRADGTLDSGFGLNGKSVYYAGEQSLLDEAICATMLGDDLFLGGYVKYVDSIQDMVVLKIKPNGERDSAWGKHGAAQLDFGDWEHVISLYPLPNGGMQVLGSSTVLRAGSRIHVAQLLPGGLPDSSFFEDGKHTIAEFHFIEGVRTVKDKDSNIFICGAVGDSPLPWLAKLDKNLQPDYSFGDSGAALFETSWEGKMYGLAVIQSGNIVVTGSQEIDEKWVSTTYMFRPTGERDSGFGTTGQITIGKSPLGDYGYDIMESNDGQLYQLTNSQENTGASTTITRWSPTGIAYWNFGKLGTYNIQFSPRQDAPYHLAKDSFGRILISGSGYIYNTYSGFLLARLWLEHTLSNNNLQYNQLAMVHPNPATTGFSIRMPGITGEQTSIQILDLQGRRVYSRLTPASESGIFELKAQDFAIQPGMYFVVVSNGDKVWSEKVQILGN